MTDQPAPVTTDTAGVNRTTDGQITTQPATDPAATSSSQTTTQPSATTQTTDTASADAADDGKSLLNQKGKDVPSGAPETYSDYKVPEGFAIDPAVKTEMDTVFKGMNLTQENAQKLVDLYTAKTKEAFDQPFKAFQDQRTEWREAAQNDPDLKGKLGPGGEVLTTINRAINSLNDPQLASAFKEAMDYTGAGDNPAFIKAFYLLSQRVTEGSHVAGRGPSPLGQGRLGTVRTPAGDLWPNLPSVANQR